MPSVTYEKVTCRFDPQERPAVDRLDLHIDDGEFLVLVGPSGCGKSTALRLVAGLERVDDGRVLIGDRDVTDLPPQQRDASMVFQNYALYPHMTVAENMAFALDVAGTSRTETADRVRDAAAMLEIVPLLDRAPKSLSGGQRQRVAMGRALVRQPRVFLLDEPLSNLDAHLRVQTRSQIAALQRRLGITTIYVTHDQVEAMTMGDRVAVLDRGVLQQCATPREMYDRPANRFVAGFLGSPAMNLLELPLDGAGARFGDVILPLPMTVRVDSGDTSVVVGLRPENLRIADHGAEIEVDVVEDLGAEAYAYGRMVAPSGVGSEMLVARADWRHPPSRGDRITLAPIDLGALHVFSAATGGRLG
ncbi:MAG: ABC transporter ATP-binding protein [Aeromicrobium sp.]